MEFQCIAKDVVLGKNVRIFNFVNLYGCTIGDGSKIGAFVEIQKNAKIGSNCKISSHTFICEGVEIEDNVFVGHGVMFINDKYPRAANPDGSLQTEADWTVTKTFIRKGASIGSGDDPLRRDSRGKCGRGRGRGGDQRCSCGSRCRGRAGTRDAAAVIGRTFRIHYFQ
jgi:acetyltransferase-like isoleucine patch superfamily enzyme